MPELSAPIYQSHEGAKGMSDSRRKLERIQLPADLRGKAVLDVGCNEGLFCHWVRERGATRVVGIDFDKPRIEFAKEKYGASGIDFRYQHWRTLPEGPFDLVLWMSAMHYEKNPKHVFDAIKNVLAPEGLLILECGVVEAPGRQMVRVQRHSDACHYPTVDLLLNDFLRGFAVRRFHNAEITEGDPIPREVFHCTPLRPVVNIVKGGTKAGKSFLAQRYLSKTATKTYVMDVIVTNVARARYHHSPLEKLIQANYDPKNLLTIHNAID